MAITDYWLGHADTTTAKVCARSDTTETLTLICNGSSYPVAADTSVNDGNIVFTVTGLSAGNSYGYSVGSVSDMLKTMPASGSFNVGWFSCIDPAGITGLSRMKLHNVLFSCTEGDTPYAENSGGIFGISYTPASTTPTEANMNAHHLSFVRNPSFAEIARFAPHYKGHDDHEWPGDDWDHTVVNANSQGLSTVTQADVDSIYVAFDNSLRSYSLGNPSNTDTDAVAEKPPSSSLLDSAYPPKYTRWIIGDCEFFLLDCISHRSASAAVDDASKTMLGSQQKLWLKNQLNASTKTFKAILSSKRVWGNAAGQGNEDEWGDYSTERDEILTYIDANVTGVIWLTGDQHSPNISASVKVASATPDIVSTGDAFDSVDVCACPISVNTQAGLTVQTQTREYFVAKAPNQHVYGILHVEGSEYVEAQIWDANDGSLVWKGRVLAGENRLTYPEISVSI